VWKTLLFLNLSLAVAPQGIQAATVSVPAPLHLSQTLACSALLAGHYAFSANEADFFDRRSQAISILHTLKKVFRERGTTAIAERIDQILLAEQNDTSMDAKTASIQVVTYSPEETAVLLTIARVAAEHIANTQSALQKQKKIGLSLLAGTLLSTLSTPLWASTPFHSVGFISLASLWALSIGSWLNTVPLREELHDGAQLTSFLEHAEKVMQDPNDGTPVIEYFWGSTVTLDRSFLSFLQEGGELSMDTFSEAEKKNLQSQLSRLLGFNRSVDPILVKIDMILDRPNQQEVGPHLTLIIETTQNKESSGGNSGGGKRRDDQDGKTAWNPELVGTELAPIKVPVDPGRR